MVRRTATTIDLYLDLNGIERGRTKGAVQRTVLKEFFRLGMHEKFYESVESLHHDLDAGLHHPTNLFHKNHLSMLLK